MALRGNIVDPAERGGVAVERGYGLEWSKVGISRTKVDEKVDNSGWRIKIVVDIPTKLSDIGGCPVEPFFPGAESGP